MEKTTTEKIANTLKKFMANIAAIPFRMFLADVLEAAVLEFFR